MAPHGGDWSRFAIECFIAMIFLAVGIFAGIALFEGPMRGQDLAAWVQALGSILAIAAAGWIARRDGRARRLEEERRSLERKTEIDRNFARAVECFSMVCEIARRTLHGSTPLSSKPRRFERKVAPYIGVLSQLALLPLPEHRNAPVIRMLALAEECEGLLSRATGASPANIRDLLNWVEKAERYLGQMQTVALGKKSP